MKCACCAKDEAKYYTFGKIKYYVCETCKELIEKKVEELEQVNKDVGDKSTKSL